MGAFTQSDLFATFGLELPNEAELVRRFRTFNEELFDGTLPRARVRWSKRMRIAGTCDHQRRIIRLSRSYHEHFPEDVDDTLKHEMIHLIHHTHDAAFKHEAARIGVSIHCREYPGLHPRARVVYICPACGTIYHRTKQERLFCGTCSRNRFDTRFQLILRPPPSRAAARHTVRIGVRRRMRSGRRTAFAAGDLFE